MAHGSDNDLTGKHFVIIVVSLTAMLMLGVLGHKALDDTNDQEAMKMGYEQVSDGNNILWKKAHDGTRTTQSSTPGPETTSGNDLP